MTRSGNGVKGGIARAKKLTEEQRRDIARRGGLAKRANAKGIPAKPASPFHVELQMYGFSVIDFQGRSRHWKQITAAGKHVTVGNWRKLRVYQQQHIEIMVYAGPAMGDNLIHQEIAYNIDDLREFLKDMCEGKFG